MVDKKLFSYLEDFVTEKRRQKFNEILKHFRDEDLGFEASHEGMKIHFK